MQTIYTFPNGQQLFISDLPVTPPTVPDVAPILLKLGPQLLINPSLLENPGPLTLHQPERTRSTPLLQGKLGTDGHLVANFNTSVLYDPTTPEYHMWYLGEKPTTHLLTNAVISSPDGIHWGQPYWLDGLGNQNELSVVIDEGVGFLPANQRFKTVLRQLTPNTVQWPADLWTSADGVNWAKNATAQPLGYGELWTPFHIGTGYGLLHRWNVLDNSPLGFKRRVGFTHGPSLSQLPPSQMVFQPSNQESAETQFYYVSNILKRGNTYIGMMGMLRDDVEVGGAPANAYGTGWTCLVWSLDGLSWNRLPESYFDPLALDPTAWDHAMAWINALVEVGDQVYLYYGGYQWGHKVNTDRQIGMVAIQKDRYAGRMDASLRTVPVSFIASYISLNFRGTIALQITDAAGVPIPGFRFADGLPFTGDSLAQRWATSGFLGDLAGRAVRLEFALAPDAELFAYTLS